MIDKMQSFLEDRKKDLSLNNQGGSIKLIMEFFSTNNKNIGHLEDPKYNYDIYKNLGWQDEEHFDVISSFWTVFACAVIREVNDNKEYSGSKRYCNFPDYINYSTPWIPGGKYGYKNDDGERQLSFPERYLKPLTGIVSIVNSTISSYPKLNELAALTHSVANFMPCPSSPYNATKGLVGRMHDFIPLFIDLIDAHCEQGKITYADPQGGRVEVNAITLQNWKDWKDWFISNRSKYCLDLQRVGGGSAGFHCLPQGCVGNHSSLAPLL